MAVRDGHSSIHFPAIGTGNLGFKKEDVSQIMTSAVRDFSREYRDKKINVCFVIFPKDTETLMVSAYVPFISICIASDLLFALGYSITWRNLYVAERCYIF